jgi:hypothetical protein
MQKMDEEKLITLGDIYRIATSSGPNPTDRLNRITKLIEEEFMHYFRPGREDRDFCDRCGLNIRSAVHKRM